MSFNRPCWPTSCCSVIFWSWKIEKRAGRAAAAPAPLQIWENQFPKVRFGYALTVRRGFFAVGLSPCRRESPEF